MTTPLKRIENFARALGATDDDLNYVIIPFVQGLMQDVANDMVPLPQQILGGNVWESWLKAIADGGVSFRVRGIPEFEELQDLQDPEIEHALRQRDARAEQLLAYVAGIIGA